MIFADSMTITASALTIAPHRHGMVVVWCELLHFIIAEQSRGITLHNNITVSSQEMWVQQIMRTTTLLPTNECTDKC